MLIYVSVAATITKTNSLTFSLSPSLPFVYEALQDDDVSPRCVFDDPYYCSLFLSLSPMITATDFFDIFLIFFENFENSLRNLTTAISRDLLRG